LKKLLCFGKGVWRELRGEVAKEGWGGEVQRQVVRWRDLDERVSKHEEPLPEDRRCLEIESPEPTWWEQEHWDEIYDERRSWGDLSREARRELRKLLRKG
jgi:hypothetical protein